MKFLVDAHLAASLCALLQQAGHNAIHTNHLAAQNQTSDEVINEISLREHRVVVTKDSDFYHSHLLHGKPWKLMLVRTETFGLVISMRFFKPTCSPSLPPSRKTRLSKSTARKCVLLPDKLRSGSTLFSNPD